MIKKVIVFYASYGGGHLSAARSIKEYIETNYPDINAELIDCVKYINKTLDVVTTKAYSEMAKKAPNAWGHIYKKSEKGALAQISNYSNRVMAIKLKKLLEDKNPDLIICTHPFASQMCSYLKRKNKINVKIATILTDFAIHNQWVVGHEFIEYFFVSHLGMKQALINEGVSPQKIHVTGIPLSNKFLLQYNKSEILESFGLTPTKKTVLFFGGGELGLGKTHTLDIFKSFVRNDNIQIVAISGKNHKMKENFESFVEEMGKESCVKVLEYTDKVAQLMSISDLVVTKPGGLTTTESLASGLPIVVINPIPGQEEENATFLEENNVAIWIKKSDNVETVLNDLFSNPNKMQEMKVNARLMAKRNSTKDICQILLKDFN